MAVFKFYDGSNWIELAKKSDIPSISDMATQTWVGNNFLPLSGGGTVTSSNAGIIAVKRSSASGGAYIDFYNKNQTTNFWRVGMHSDDYFAFQDKNNAKLFKVDTSGNAEVAGGLKIDALTSAGFVKTDSSGNLSVDTTSYVPYSGATSNVDLGNYTLIAKKVQASQEVNITSGASEMLTISPSGIGKITTSPAFIGSWQFPSESSGTLTTREWVTTQINALPSPMIFKGTVGSNGTVEWSNLPSAAAANEGFTYKVITAHSGSDPVCAVGDTIISNGSSWIVIPSGDEPVGTVTNVATGTGLTGGPITSSGTISVDTSWMNSNYLPLSGGTLTGNLTIGDSSNGANLVIGAQNDAYGLLPYADTWNQIGASGRRWYRAYVYYVYGDIIYEGSVALSDKYLAKAGGAITGSIARDAGGSWINARDNVLIKTTRTSNEGADWHPAVGVKTSSGFWSFGSVGGETLCLSYDTDTDYSNNNNTSAVINFPSAGRTGTIALTSDIPSLSGYATETWVGNNYLKRAGDGYKPPMSNTTLSSNIWSTYPGTWTADYDAAPGYEYGQLLRFRSAYAGEGNAIQMTDFYIRDSGDALWVRNNWNAQNNTETTQWPWHRIALHGDNISVFNNDSGYITSSALSNYLPLTGGTLTGTLTMTKSGITTTLGSENSGWFHIQSEAPVYFGESISVNGGIDIYNTSYGINSNGFSTLSGLAVINDNSNNSYDALAYFRSYNSADWGVLIDKNGQYDYGLRINCSASASYALDVYGSTQLHNNLTVGGSITGNSGGIVTGADDTAFIFKAGGNYAYSNIIFEDSSGNYLGNLGFDASKNLSVYDRRSGVTNGWKEVALREDIPSLTNYATKTWVMQNYLPLSGVTSVNGGSARLYADNPTAATGKGYLELKDSITLLGTTTVSTTIYAPTYIAEYDNRGVELGKLILPLIGMLGQSSERTLATTADIGSGVLTIQQNGTTIDTFSANATSNKTINITTSSGSTTHVYMHEVIFYLWQYYFSFYYYSSNTNQMDIDDLMNMVSGQVFCTRDDLNPTIMAIGQIQNGPDHMMCFAWYDIGNGHNYVSYDELSIDEENCWEV